MVFYARPRLRRWSMIWFAMFVRSAVACWFCHAVDTASLATWQSFGKLIGVATLFVFGEKRCRKKPSVVRQQPMEKFNFATAWIFASVTAEGGVDLPILIGTADSLNHAIPTVGEISRSLKALHVCGLVEIADGRIQLTDHGRTVADEGFGRRGGRFSIPDNMRKSLDAATHPTIETKTRSLIRHR